MNKEQLIARLLELPNAIAAAENDMILAQADLNAAKSELQFKEDELYLGIYEDKGMVIDGKNAEIRASQMRSFTAPERNKVALVEHIAFKCRYRLDKLRNELKALQAIADLVRGAA